MHISWTCGLAVMDSSGLQKSNLEFVMLSLAHAGIRQGHGYRCSQLCIVLYDNGYCIKERCGSDGRLKAFALMLA
jgi:hypothetical protein